MRKTVERSACETGTFGSLAASALKFSISLAGTVRQIGSVKPPCGGIKSAIVLLSTYQSDAWRSAVARTVSYAD